MNSESLTRHADQYLQTLCADFPSRRVGNPANQAATRFFKSAMQDLGLKTETQRFNCTDHRAGEIHLSCGKTAFEAQISPHSLGCEISTELASAANLEELKSGDFRGKILLLTGELTKEQLMPKNFPFYNPDSHKEIYRLLESQQPVAIITATGRNPELAGASYPFPLIEDGDFDIPSAFMTDVESDKLSRYLGKSIRLSMDAKRSPSWAENVVVHFGKPKQERLVVCAHIDSKDGTPGAVDNASGVVILLLLAELLKDKVKGTIELVALNGEDHYSAGGEKAYLQHNQDSLNTIHLVINVDGAGYKDFPNEVSFYGCPAEIETCALAVMETYPAIRHGEPWFQSDHMVFAMQQIPAMAITTSAFMQMEKEIAHTQKDVPALVDRELLADTARYIHEVIRQCGKGKSSV